eukprot:TRINITY_DN11199_c0_g1_i1.p1 TRINITY_DN11199_c0_g1~~TRINITY_DN11199_c0_g1_i1.p1  ORF type:complete len:537 (-),score=198.80 TRINITY_DN11199_c0_g1_i1:62-1672(-)
MLKGWNDLVSQSKQQATALGSKFSSSVVNVSESIKKPLEKVSDSVKPLSDQMYKPLVEAPKQLLASSRTALVEAPKQLLASSRTLALNMVTAPPLPPVQLPAEFYTGPQIRAGFELNARHEQHAALVSAAHRNLGARADAADRTLSTHVIAVCAGKIDAWNRLARECTDSLPGIALALESLTGQIGELCGRVETLEQLLGEQTERLAAEALEQWTAQQATATTRLGSVRAAELVALENKLEAALIRREEHKFELERLALQQRLREQELRERELEVQARQRLQQLEAEARRHERELSQQAKAHERELSQQAKARERQLEIEARARQKELEMQAAERRHQLELRAREQERADRLREQEVALERQREALREKQLFQQALEREVRRSGSSHRSGRSERHSSRHGRHSRHSSKRSLSQVDLHLSHDPSLEEFLGPRTEEDEQEQQEEVERAAVAIDELFGRVPDSPEVEADLSTGESVELREKAQRHLSDDADDAAEPSSSSRSTTQEKNDELPSTQVEADMSASVGPLDASQDTNEHHSP